VDVVDDGGRDSAASAAVAAGAEAGGVSGRAPSPSAAYAGAHEDPDRAGGGVDLAEHDGEARHARGRGAAGTATRTGRRRLTWRVVLFTLLLVAVVGGAIATIQWYGRAAYYVGFEGDRVAIFKGRPGGLLWIEPSLVETTELERDRVPPARLNDIETGKEQGSLAEAQRYVANVSDQADELDPPTTTTTRPRTTTTTRSRTTTTRAPATATTRP
jgi:PPM family protein phosphatase